MGNMARSHESRKKKYLVWGRFRAKQTLPRARRAAGWPGRPPSSPLRHHPPPLPALDSNISGYSSPGRQSLPHA
jgi:hypothetical protein